MGKADEYWERLEKERREKERRERERREGPGVPITKNIRLGGKKSIFVGVVATIIGSLMGGVNLIVIIGLFFLIGGIVSFCRRG